MACVNPDGTLSASAASILRALASAADLDEAARATGLPLFRVKAGVRELSQAKLVEEVEGRFQPTAAGLELVRSADA